MKLIWKILKYCIVIPNALLTGLLLAILISEDASDSEFIVPLIVGIPTWIWLLSLNSKEKKNKRSKRQILRRANYSDNTTSSIPESVDYSDDMTSGMPESADYSDDEDTTSNIPERTDYSCDDTMILSGEFEKIAIKCAKRIRRLTVSVNGTFVNGSVEAQSGISVWSFTLDFNHYGKITGKSWMIKRGNYDSKIPDRYAELMLEAIKDALLKS